MKKYTKPMIVFESFSLSMSIAACQNEATHDDSIVGGCKGYLYPSDFGDLVLFLHDYEGCGHTPPQNYNDPNSICYDVPTLSLYLFGS